MNMKKYKVVFVWRFLTPNSGDLASSPWNYLYFQKDVTAKIDISRDLQSPKVLKILAYSELIIVGGGGLLGLKKYFDKIQFIVTNYSEKTVIWGAGSNWPRRDPPAELPSLQNCLFSGIRDFPLSATYAQYSEQTIRGSTYLPCASSLELYFLSYWKCKFLDRKKQNLHKNHRPNLKVLFSSNDAGKQAQSFPSSFMNKVEKVLSKNFDCSVSTIGNSNIRMLSCLDAIQSADLIFTRSYHFAYWGLLLGKPVIAVPTSSKFNSIPSLYNNYLLFASCSEVFKFISSVNTSIFEEFIFKTSTSHDIHYYLQSLLLNLSAARNLYSQIGDLESYKIFSSKYYDLLKILPTKVFSDIGINLKPSPQSDSSSSLISSRTSLTASEVDMLMTLYSGASPLLADNAINQSVELSEIDLQDYKCLALNNIQNSISDQVNCVISLGLMHRIKRRLKIIVNMLLS